MYYDFPVQVYDLFAFDVFDRIFYLLTAVQYMLLVCCNNVIALYYYAAVASIGLASVYKEGLLMCISFRLYSVFARETTQNAIYCCSI